GGWGVGTGGRPRRWSGSPSGRTGPRPRTRPRRFGRGGRLRGRRPCRAFFSERVLRGRVGRGVFRPRPEAGEAEGVEQVVGGLEAANDAELGLQDPADVFAAEGADAVVGGRPGPDAGRERRLLGGGQWLLPAPARPVRQPRHAGAALPAHPPLDR